MSGEKVTTVALDDRQRKAYEKYKRAAQDAARPNRVSDYFWGKPQEVRDWEELAAEQELVSTIPPSHDGKTWTGRLGSTKDGKPGAVYIEEG